MLLKGLRGLCALAVLLLVASSVNAQAVLSETFTTDPAARGWAAYSPQVPKSWLYGPYTGPTWWTAGNAYVTAATSQHMVHSPDFAVTGDQYYRIAFDSRCVSGPAMLHLVGTNADASYGLWTKPPSWYGEPGELTPVATRIAQSADWVSNVEYIRARPNAVNSYVRFQANSATESSDLHVDNVTVEPVSHAAVLAAADALYAQMPQVDYTPAENRFDALQRTRAKIAAGQPVTIVMLGDSIMDDTANSTLDVLLERQWGVPVRVVSAVGSGTSMKDWNNPVNTDPDAKYLNLQENVLDMAPDLVMLGGISNRTEPGSLPCYNDFRGVIGKLRDGIDGQYGYQVDILLLTGVLSAYGDASGYAAGLQAIADDLGTGMFDIRSAWNQYLSAAAGDGWAHADFMRDSGLVHGNTYGKQAVGRILEAYLVPEPASCALLVCGALALLRRRR